MECEDGQGEPSSARNIPTAYAPIIQLELIDFGASQEYPPAFISQYRQLLLAAVRADRKSCGDLSRAIGYLTPDDSQVGIMFSVLRGQRLIAALPRSV